MSVTKRYPLTLPLEDAISAFGAELRDRLGKPIEKLLRERHELRVTAAWRDGHYWISLNPPHPHGEIDPVELYLPPAPDDDDLLGAEDFS